MKKKTNTSCALSYYNGKYDAQEVTQAIMNCNYELKRQVWRATLQGQAVVTDTVTFTQVAVRKCPNIKIMYVTKEDITELTSHLQERWAQTRPLPGTHKCHFVKPVLP